MKVTEMIEAHALSLTLHFDGGCTPNPGGACRFGWHVENAAGEQFAKQSGMVEPTAVAERTNNTAEWAAVHAALSWLTCLCPRIASLRIVGDSNMVINQLRGEWKARKPHLARYRDSCRLLLDALAIAHLQIEWVPRNENSQADRLAASA